jgi:hypothetical protein
MPFRTCLCLPLAAFFLASCVYGSAQTLAPQEKTDLLHRMNGVYYSLANQNFKGVQCSVDADYPAFFAQMPEMNDHPEKVAEFKKAFSKVTTQLTVGADGHAKVVTTGADTSSSGMSTAMDSMTTGFNQSIQGFFLAWSSFTLSTPLPYKAADVDIRPTPDGYTLTKSADSQSIEADFSKDLVLQHMSIDTTRASIVEDVTFLPVAGGQLLSSMKANMELKPSSKMPVTEIDATYQTVGGLQLPQTLTVKVEVPGTPPLVATLRDCKLN